MHIFFVGLIALIVGFAAGVIFKNRALKLVAHERVLLNSELMKLRAELEKLRSKKLRTQRPKI